MFEVLRVLIAAITHHVRGQLGQNSLNLSELHISWPWQSFSRWNRGLSLDLCWQTTRLVLLSLLNAILTTLESLLILCTYFKFLSVFYPLQIEAASAGTLRDDFSQKIVLPSHLRNNALSFPYVVFQRYILVLYEQVLPFELLH